MGFENLVSRLGYAKALLKLACGMGAAALCLVGISAVAAGTSDAVAVAEVTKAEHDLERFYNSEEFVRNPSAGLAYYANVDSVSLFEITQPGVFRGEQFRSHIIDLGKQFEGGKVEFFDLEVIADKNLAFATSRQRYAGTFKDGTRFDMMMLVTDCLRKESGRWLIVHEHVSLPLDVSTFMTMIKPKK